MNFAPKILIIFSIVIFVFSFGQTTPPIQDSVDIIPVWKVNEIKNIKVKSTTTDIVNNKKTIAKYQYDAHFKILKVDENGYDVEWLFTNAIISKGGDFVVEDNIFSKLENQRILIRISNTGKFVELINRETLQKKTHMIVDELIAKEKNPKIKTEYQIVKALISIKDGFNNTLLKPIGLYYFYFGNHVKLYQKQHNNVTLPNPFDDEVFSAEEIVEMTQLSSDHSSLTIETSKKVPNDKVKKSYINLLTKTKPDQAKQIIQPFKNSEFEFSEKRKQIIDLKNNTVTSGIFNTIMKIGPHSRTSLWEIEGL
ncbi:MULTISPECIES: hypothetical protein [Chryseobacterium]|uniref:hypothetical protein n=1 Tax=Chryseobacterium TaxID=59732 RepID=UPI000C9EC66C|nr:MULTISPECIES: hypothetical protein [Chryseobacterium]VXB78218.1 conserved hypothetical protein [Chryseobacterium sp. 8AT]